uniref:Vesicle-associated membrane protein 7 n=1 Tax=Cyprinus carpio TaxID=7962 RepID=A0A8C1YAY6_CYPCA
QGITADNNAEPQAPSKLSQVQDQVNDVKVILKDNIDKVLERGERLDNLIDITDNLQVTVITKHFYFIFLFMITIDYVCDYLMWWRNTKMMIIIGVVVLAIIILIILLATQVIPT